MDFRKFLESDTVNEDLIVEKVTKETNSILKPYTQKVCEKLVSYGIDPQSAETSFVKLDDSVIEEMRTSAQIFRVFKRALVDTGMAKVSSDKKLINNGQCFIASVSNGDRCVLVALFKLTDEDRFIRVDDYFGGVRLNSCNTYEPCKFNKFFSEISQKGEVSIFVVTTSFAEKENLKRILANRRKHWQDVEDTEPGRLRRNRETDLNNYKIIKQIGKYGDKLNSIVADIIDTLENNSPVGIDYVSIKKDINIVKKALTNISNYHKSNYEYDWSSNYYLDKLKEIPRLNESIPNNVRKIIDMSSSHGDLYRSLLRVGIAAESADYTILDDEADKFNKSPGFKFYDYEWEDRLDEDPARINIVKRLLRRYDALLLARDRYYAIVTLKNGRVKCEGSESLFDNKIFTIVGISGGSLDDVKLEKNVRTLQRMKTVHADLLELVKELSETLDDIDYNRDLFYNDKDNIVDAIKLCDTIERTCKSLIIRH